MSKKRLEEIPYNVRISLHDDENVLIKREDYEFLYEQAEKVQELEDKLLHMKGKYIGFKGECKKELLHLIEENKRYREAIGFGIEYLKNSDIRQVQLVVTALKSALEGGE